MPEVLESSPSIDRSLERRFCFSLSIVDILSGLLLAGIASGSLACTLLVGLLAGTLLGPAGLLSGFFSDLFFGFLLIHGPPFCLLVGAYIYSELLR